MLSARICNYFVVKDLRISGNHVSVVVVVAVVCVVVVGGGGGGFITAANDENVC